VTVTHPFHPQSGQTFELIRVAASRHGDRVWVRGQGGIRIPFPRAWTSLADTDVWRQAAGGRTPFRLDDLLAVADRVAVLRRARVAASAGGGADV